MLFNKKTDTHSSTPQKKSSKASELCCDTNNENKIVENYCSEIMDKKSRASLNKDGLRSLIQLPVNDGSEPIIYHSSSHICFVTKDLCIATGSDSQFLLKIPEGRKKLSISVQIISPRSEGQIIIYYSCEKVQRYSEKNKYVLGRTDGKKYVHHLSFPAPVFWLRIDPIDVADNFTILLLDVSISENTKESSSFTDIGSLYFLPVTTRWQLLKSQFAGRKWVPSRTVVFVTHEITGTGAPLLCRKMSAYAKRKGLQTVIISLPGQGEVKEDDIRLFSQSCDILLLCQQDEDMSNCIIELQELGINRVLLNSIVSGRAIKQFSDAGFKTICLIHEMKCSCKILQAERWIDILAENAGTLVFPAKCVRDDFESFGVKIKGETLILPQGFYKDIERAVGKNHSRDTRESLLRRLNLTEDAILIIGAGSINYGKGTDLLSLIAQELMQCADKEYHFLWLGTANDCHYEIWLLNQIEKMGLADRFHFLGYISDETEYMDLISSCSALALVSREDSYPSVMIEAMACGIPVVAFRDSGGAQELLDDGRGYLVDYLDVRQYAQVLKTISEEPEKTKIVTDKACAYFDSCMKFDEYVRRILDTFDSNKDGVG